jgi:hypothetical protein
VLTKNSNKTRPKTIQKIRIQQSKIKQKNHAQKCQKRTPKVRMRSLLLFKTLSFSCIAFKPQERMKTRDNQRRRIEMVLFLSKNALLLCVVFCQRTLCYLCVLFLSKNALLFMCAFFVKERFVI